MNGLDYTKQLSKDREYLRDTAQKTKKASEKLVSDTNDRADHVMEKQKNVFIEDKAELEGNYQKNLDQLKEKTSSSIESIKDKKRAELEKAREDFSSDSNTNRKEFNQRLSDIKTSYKKTSDNEKDLNKQIGDNRDQSYSRNLSSLLDKQEKQIEGYKNKMAGTGNGIRDGFRVEKEQIIGDYEDKINNLKKDQIKDESDLKEKLSTNLTKTKDVNEAEKEQLKSYSADKMNLAQKTFSDRTTKMAQDYTDRHTDLAKNQRYEATKTNQNHQNHVEDMQRTFNSQLRSINNEKRRRQTDGSAEVSGLMSGQTVSKDAQVKDNRIQDLQDKLADTKLTYHNKAVDEEREHFRTLKDQSSEATANLDKKTTQLITDKIQTVAHERAQSLKKLSNSEQQNRLAKQASDQQLSFEGKQSNERINNLKESFNKSMKTMETNSRLNIEDVTKVANEDKADFIKKANEERTKELYTMKREFDLSTDLMVEGYEQRLAKYKRENENLKTTMDHKINQITNKKDQELEMQHKLSEGRRIAEAKGSQLQLDQREHKLRSSINDLTHRFQVKMDVMHANNDTKIKLLTDDYEAKLKELTVSKTKELTEKDMSQANVIERLKQSYENEKARIVSGFENQIQSMKVSFKEQLDQAKDLKRIS